MRELSIDIETYSDVNIKDGIHRYVDTPNFEILLFAYAFDNEPVRVIDLYEEKNLPQELINAIYNPEIKKTAWNAAFERVCISRFLHGYNNWNASKAMSALQWECTAHKASMLGLPLKLDIAAKALHLNNLKIGEGKALIKYFCVPCKPSKVNGGRLRNLPEHDIDKWSMFIKYCKGDVAAEREIKSKIRFFSIPEAEKRLYDLDQRINDRGVAIDTTLVKQAVNVSNEYKQRLTEEVIELTKLENPNSVSQLKRWLSVEMETEEEIESLTKKDIPALLKLTDNKVVERVLHIRQKMAKTSVKKYNAMLTAESPVDGRIRGLLQIYGANRTGRWAGRLVQVQNLPKNNMQGLELAREVVKDGNVDLMDLLYASIPDVLSQLIRTALVPAKGKEFVVTDFKAIEARVIAWLAGEKWRMDVFRDGVDIYSASYAAMFHVPIESIGKKSDERQRGKVAELALGYQGGPGALITMGALEKGLTEEELPGLVDAWRAANKKIVALWKDVQNCAFAALENPGVTIKLHHGLEFFYKFGEFFIKLPSGRHLAYAYPAIGDGKYGPVITYWGVDQKKKTWGRMDTYGGKMVENIVQAIARDCLAEALLKLDDCFYDIVMHIHDEIVSEVDIGTGLVHLDRQNEILAQPISWAPGLLLEGDGFVGSFYKKDD